MEKDEVMQDNQEIIKELNRFFKIRHFYIGHRQNIFIINHKSQNIVDSIDRAIEIIQTLPSLIEKVDNQKKFSFEQVSFCDIVKEIKGINPTKSSTMNSIAPKILNVTEAAVRRCFPKQVFLKISQYLQERTSIK